MRHEKYKPFPPIELRDRTWPHAFITQAPRWCSVDLRDGNQALVTPMTIEQKLEMFHLLCAVGFKEIEVGFPSAAEVEYDFVRLLIEDNLIPEDVTIQVLTQAREHLIKKTCESLQGAKRAMIHLYNSTSELQRRVVFRMDRDQVRDLAVQGTEWVKQYAAEYLSGAAVYLEYTPESFMGTELDFAVEVCDAVIDTWGPVDGEKVVINLPSTVEITTPNIWADQIEWFGRHLRHREEAVISVHCHNDRGTAVAATELSVLAGAERVEGTLFGNGERTGNVDLVTLALNLYSQGIDPTLDFHNLPAIRETYERCTGLGVHSRHPYAGDLVFTAFSGSHQDAINKGIRARQENGSSLWEVPYIPIDPSDIGRSYEAIVRINSQSGKGGVAFIMEQKFGYRLPKTMHPEFGAVIQKISDQTGQEILPQTIWETFRAEYIERTVPFSLNNFQMNEKTNGTSSTTAISVEMNIHGVPYQLAGTGNGPIDAFTKALKEKGMADFTFVSYDEHALESGEDARAVTYIQIKDQHEQMYFGVGVDHNIVGASIKAVLSALNRSWRDSAALPNTSLAVANQEQVSNHYK